MLPALCESSVRAVLNLSANLSTSAASSVEQTPMRSSSVSSCSVRTDTACRGLRAASEFFPRTASLPLSHASWTNLKVGQIRHRRRSRCRCRHRLTVQVRQATDVVEYPQKYLTTTHNFQNLPGVLMVDRRRHIFQDLPGSRWYAYA